MSPRGILNKNQNKTLAKRYAKEKLTEAGFDVQEWRALNTLWNKESRWDSEAKNPKSSAYGIPQMLKMPEGTPVKKQIDLGLKYIQKRYKTPTLALEHHNKKGWY